MKVVFGAVIGSVVSLFLFFVMHYNQLLLVGEHKAGLLLTMQLNNSANMYMWAGAIIGAIVALSNNMKKA